ncbi:ABC transporter ATP-binding protein [Polynucleobacter paneuropaeus]|uniref:ABC transporter ATP-binding protein n=1 Tax=Polynucleobacter paneuropaeus TaxID=2527775 RepID=A0A9Q2WJ74_9BURK|nr:ABC transporter ATP-binding protein [Polynucleobacter paneuropaeus]
MRNKSNKIESTFGLLKTLWDLFHADRKIALRHLLVLMIFSSFLEFIAVGSILPFLIALTSPDKILQHKGLQNLLSLFGITRSQEIIYLFAVFFIAAALFSSAIRLKLLKYQVNLCHLIGADLSATMYRRILLQPYTYHISSSSSELIAGIHGKTNSVVNGVILPALNIFSSFILLATFVVGLMMIEPKPTFFIFLAFGLIYALTIYFSKRKLKAEGKIFDYQSGRLIKSLQDGLGSIRDILLDGTQNFYCNIFHQSEVALRTAQAKIIFISSRPRYYIETALILLVAIFAIVLTVHGGSITSYIPFLGLLAMGAQRLLPVLQLLFSSIASILGSNASLSSVIGLLTLPIPAYECDKKIEALTFKESLQFNHISFSYPDRSTPVLKGIDLYVKRGSRIGIIGASGKGKSTFLDILMGLLEITSGSILVDGTEVSSKNIRGWQKHIAHVPQSIFLTDATVAENIAFGVPFDMVDMNLVMASAKIAQIHDVIMDWNDGYSTMVGERGAKISGGQRQRLGIARALYKKADILIFDEATSALDSQTEELVMNSITGISGELTIFIVAHRLNTLKSCNQILELNDGRFKSIK